VDSSQGGVKFPTGGDVQIEIQSAPARERLSGQAFASSKVSADPV